MKHTRILIPLLFLVGCSERVGPQHIENALTACNKNGGVSHFNVNSTFQPQHVLSVAYCNDGAVFDSTVFALPIKGKTLQELREGEN